MRFPLHNRAECFEKSANRDNFGGISANRQRYALVESSSLPTRWFFTMAKASRQQTVVNIEAALRRLNGDRELLVEMAQFFREDHGELLCKIKQNQGLGDFAEVKRAAHSLKGMAGTFDAHRVTALAERLEEAADSRDEKRVSTIHKSLQTETAAMLLALDDYCLGEAEDR